MFCRMFYGSSLSLVHVVAALRPPVLSAVSLHLQTFSLQLCLPCVNNVCNNIIVSVSQLQLVVITVSLTLTNYWTLHMAQFVWSFEGSRWGECSYLCMSFHMSEIEWTQATISISSLIKIHPNFSWYWVNHSTLLNWLLSNFQCDF